MLIQSIIQAERRLANRPMKFKDKDTEAIHHGRFTKKFGPEVVRAARRKLTMLKNAKVLEDVRNPPGNHLKPLKDDRQGQHSIKVNDQWRICFKWTDSGPEDVELVDYH
jgi:proteic killer suppression protein